MKTVIGSSLFAFFALGASTFASVFANITVDGDFSDWAGIPAIVTDVSGDGSPADFLNVYAANDDDWLYLHFTMSGAASLNDAVQLFIAIDNDSNTATGFDIFGLGAIGSDVGWQNDFPFQQSSSNFNSGDLDNGAAGIAPYFTSTNAQEIRISRSATFQSDGTSIFPNNTINIAFYSNGTTQDDFSGVGSYTFAIPEPATPALLALFGAIFAVRRRRA